eukprot:TRINITY_DN3292_c0_g1_i1.p1 TRINITY_DN3292_c0_g1~~TRINITY_DN3292_c0_g1_i1.p1  ORF type:complete len:451 (+),score=61.02 TRINITY_DN3292_c0_g1_i1:3-1355(+)
MAGSKFALLSLGCVVQRARPFQGKMRQCVRALRFGTFLRHARRGPSSALRKCAALDGQSCAPMLEEDPSTETDDFGAQGGIDEERLRNIFSSPEFKKALPVALHDAGLPELAEAEIVVPKNGFHGGDGKGGVVAEVGVKVPPGKFGPKQRERFEQALMNAIKAAGKSRWLPENWRGSAAVTNTDRADVQKEQGLRFYVEVPAAKDSTQTSAQEAASKVAASANSLCSFVNAQVSVLQNVNLELCWGYPEQGKDFLDGAALAFADETLVQTVDYQSGAKEFGPWRAPSLYDDGAGVVFRSLNCDPEIHEDDDISGAPTEVKAAWAAVRKSVRHSGDLMNDKFKLGKHIMNVDLSLLPAGVNHMYFLLSAFNCDDISAFRRPWVRLMNADQPGHQLTEYNIDKAGDAQAVVMCSLCRSSGPWEVKAIGVTCNGNIKDYAPLVAACRDQAAIR